MGFLYSEKLLGCLKSLSNHHFLKQNKCNSNFNFRRTYTTIPNIIQLRFSPKLSNFYLSRKNALE